MTTRTLRPLGALLHAPAPARSAPPAALSRDEVIRVQLQRQLAREGWWDSRTANVFVDDGVVVYQGVRTKPDNARAMALALPGVRDVWDARVARREWQGWA